MGRRRRAAQKISSTQAAFGYRGIASNMVLLVGCTLIMAEVGAYVVGDQSVPRDLLTTLAQVQATLLVAVAVLPAAPRTYDHVMSSAGALGAALWGTLGMLLAEPHSRNQLGHQALGIGLALILAATVIGAASLFADLADKPKR